MNLFSKKSDATSKETFPQTSSIRCTAVLGIFMTYSSDSSIWFKKITEDILPKMYHLTKKHSNSVAERNVPAFCKHLGSGFCFH